MHTTGAKAIDKMRNRTHKIRLDVKFVQLAALTNATTQFADYIYKQRTAIARNIAIFALKTGAYSLCLIVTLAIGKNIYDSYAPCNNLDNQALNTTEFKRCRSKSVAAKQSKIEEERKNSKRLDLAVLSKDFDENKARFKLNWDQKWLRYKGRIGNLTESSYDFAPMPIYLNGKRVDVKCSSIQDSIEEVAAINRGSMTTVTGKLTKFSYEQTWIVEMVDCKIENYKQFKIERL